MNICAMHSPRSVCSHCANWIVYPYFIGKTLQEGSRCRNAVTGAGTRAECACYLREPGADDDL